MIYTRDQLSEHDYHTSRAITWHRLKDFITGGPLYYFKRHVSGEIPAPPDRPWGKLGRAYHIYGLEGRERFLASCIAMPETYMGPESAKKDAPTVEKPWNMNATVCKEWVANEVSKGKLVLSPDEYAQAIAIGENMRADPVTSPYLRIGFQEITVQQTDERFPVPLRGRLDWLTSTSPKLTDAVAIIDPKGTANLAKFEYDAHKLGYARQMAFYRKLVRDEIGLTLPTILTAIEKGGTHRVRGYMLTDRLLDKAEEKNNYDLDRLAYCYKSNQWPLDFTSEMHELDLPAWEQGDAAQAEVIEEEAPW